MPDEPPHRRALERFQDYEQMADSLETYKRITKRHRKTDQIPSPMARSASMNCEEALEDAYAELYVIARFYDKQAAAILAGHFLLGMTWFDVACLLDLSIYQAKWRGYKALRWLDSQQEDGGILHGKPEFQARRGSDAPPEADEGQRGV